MAGPMAPSATWGIIADDLGQLPRMLAPPSGTSRALWLLVGLATALFGVAPRADAEVWAVLGFCVVIGMLGEVLDLPTWVNNVSPFQHTPQLPAAELNLAPLAVLTTIAAGLTCVGPVASRRRGIGQV